MTLPIIGIGASAGGIEALQRFFRAVPRDLGAAFVVVVHLSPEHESSLGDVLATTTSMAVTQVEAAMTLEPNHVYVIAPGQRLELTDSLIRATPFDEPRGQRSPVDGFFRSLATHHAHAFAIVLSGGGSDGALGVKAIKEAGGIILVQDPREAAFDSMPRAAIATGLADVVLPVERIAERLGELVRHERRIAPLLSPEPRRGLEPGEREALATILDQVRARTGHDFTNYKESTVLRRLGRRMQVNGNDSLREYLAFLLESDHEVRALFADLLISVTAFFRDPAVFEALQEKVLPKLIEQAGEERDVRVWVAGCATGEEAFSIAMLLAEATPNGSASRAQIFATDIDETALSVGRVGLYPVGIEADVSAPRLHRFFTKKGNGYLVTKNLRGFVIFALHSILRDPPFSRLDLVSCRNLLIYLGAELQEQAFAVFHHSLRPGGTLLLGLSEQADPAYFRAIDNKLGLYVARETVRPSLPERLFQAPHLRLADALVPSEPIGEPASVVHRGSIEDLGPPSALVDERGTVVHLSETAGFYLQPRVGPLSHDLTELVRPELQNDLRMALSRAFEDGESALTPFVSVRTGGSRRRVALLVRPRRRDDREARLALISFIDAGDDPGPPTEPVPAPEPAANAERLRAELLRAEKRTRAVREAYEAAKEEYRSTNEELQSLNEEYRATAEELETSKEELQSVNEELSTVNAELQTNLAEVSRANADLENLMAATDIGTLFLDPALRVQRFTPRVTELFRVTPADRGRAIDDFTTVLDYVTLADDARRVLRDDVSLERDARSNDGRFFLVQLRPYRTAQDQVAGVVVTFVDITAQKRSAAALRESQRQLAEELAATKRLHTMAMMVVTAPTMQEALGEILSGAMDIHGTGLGTLQLVAPESGTLELVAHHGFGREFIERLQSATADDGSAGGRAFGSGRREVVHDTETDARYAPYREAARTAGYRAVQSTPLIGRDGRVIGVVSTYFTAPSSISERDQQLLDVVARNAANLIERVRAEAVLQENERQLRKQTSLLRDNDRRRLEFIASLSHELRNPLATLRNGVTILMTNEVWADEVGRGQVRRTVAMLDRQVQLMTRLVDDVLDVTRISRGKVRLDRQPIAVRDVVEMAVEGVWAESERRGIRLDVDLGREQLFILADQERMGQILDNLLGNALKFTDTGGRVAVTVGREHGQAVIRVSDDGIGLTPDNIAHLFAAFVQGGDSNTGGLGLGLTLVKSLVDLHGGTVEAQSEGPNQGSTFVVRLPSCEPRSLEAEERKPVAHAPRRILVVDDNADAAESFALLLRAKGHEVEAAENGEAALALARRMRPRVAFLDLSMPGMDGYELARRLRREFPPGELTLVAMSGYAEIPRVREAGFDEHLLKPVDVDAAMALCS